MLRERDGCRDRSVFKNIGMFTDKLTGQSRSCYIIRRSTVHKYRTCHR